MYQVTVHHHDKDIVRGDLEDKIEFISSQIFKTKHAAKNWISEKLKGKPKRQISCYPHTGNTPSNYYYFTGVKWQHENSGEMMEEYYQYKLEKVKLR